MKFLMIVVVAALCAMTVSAYPEEYECLIDAIGVASKQNGLDEQWALTEPDLRESIESWKNCRHFPPSYFQQMCALQKNADTNVFIDRYIREVSAENKKIIPDFIDIAQEKCFTNAFADVMNDLNDNGSDSIDINADIGEKLKCIIEAITDAFDQTGYEGIWKEYQKDLEKLHDHIKACKNEPSKWEAAKCVANEAKYAREILWKFISNLKKENYDLYVRSKNNIKQRCLQRQN